MTRAHQCEVSQVAVSNADRLSEWLVFTTDAKILQVLKFWSRRADFELTE